MTDAEQTLANIRDLLERQAPTAAIYGLVAEFFSRHQEMKCCDYCGRAFLTGLGTGRRSSARFCSDKHRTYWRRHGGNVFSSKIGQRILMLETVISVLDRKGSDPDKIAEYRRQLAELEAAA